jgi:Fe-S-cluster containining protein
MVWRRGTSKRPVAWMLLPTDAEGTPTELATWSMLALEKSSFEIVRAGAAKGLATMRIPRDYEQAVEEWCERDSKWSGTTRDVGFDCLECGSCCRDNRVILYDEDYARWKAAGRDDLFGKPYLRNVKGIVMLRLRNDEEKNCVHLKSDNKCGIYAIRPYNCSSFPVGSEPCLESRREELDDIDGAPLREPEDRFVPRFGP